MYACMHVWMYVCMYGMHGMRGMHRMHGIHDMVWYGMAWHGMYVRIFPNIFSQESFFSKG